MRLSTCHLGKPLKYQTGNFYINLFTRKTTFSAIFQSNSEAMEAKIITQSMAKNDKTIDPYVNLIINDDLAENKWPKVLDEYKKEKKQSLMVKVMNAELFEKLKNLKTKSGGWTIARSINTGTCHQDSFVGCHAGDLESYHLFSDFFSPLIESYHLGYKVDGSMKHITNMDPENISTELSKSAFSKIISSRIRCARNLARFPLSTAGTLKTRLQVASLMEEVFSDIPSNPDLKDLAGTFYRHTTMTDTERQQLIDDHFLFKGRDKMQAASGFHQFWPEGRGIFLSDDKRFLLWVNEGDHLRIISMQQGGDLKAVFAVLSKGVAAIESELQKITGETNVFMSDPILGMITCCPSNLGTGLRASIHIKVPKLIRSIGFEEINKIAQEMNCQARGTMGEHTEVIDRIDISNWRRLGFPEHELVEDMIKCANKIAHMEDELED